MNNLLGRIFKSDQTTQPRDRTHKISDIACANLLTDYDVHFILPRRNRWIKVHESIEIRVEMQIRYAKSLSKVFIRNTTDTPIEEINFYLEAQEYFDGFSEGYT